MSERDHRQELALNWAEECFGEEAFRIPQRGLRLVEEAIELAQACGTDKAKIHALIDYIYAKPAGTIIQELGGVGLTTLVLAAAAHVSADGCEAAEFARVLAKPRAHFSARNATKNRAGFWEPTARPEASAASPAPAFKTGEA